MTTFDLLTAAKANSGIPSNERLARILDVPDNTVVRWNTGRNKPDDEMVRRLAELAGLDPAPVVAAIRAERAAPGPMRDLWSGMAAMLSKASATAALAVVAVTRSPDAGAWVSSPAQPLPGCILCQIKAVA